MTSAGLCLLFTWYGILSQVYKAQKQAFILFIMTLQEKKQRSLLNVKMIKKKFSTKIYFFSTSI